MALSYRWHDNSKWDERDVRELDCSLLATVWFVLLLNDTISVISEAEVYM